MFIGTSRAVEVGGRGLRGDLLGSRAVVRCCVVCGSRSLTIHTAFVDEFQRTTDSPLELEQFFEPRGGRVHHHPSRELDVAFETYLRDGHIPDGVHARAVSVALCDMRLLGALSLSRHRWACRSKCWRQLR